MKFNLPSFFLIGCFVSVATALLSTAVYSNTDDDVLLFLPGVISSINKTPRPDFQVLLPTSFADGEEYLIDVEQWQISTTKTNPIETTVRIQAAIDDAVAKGFEKIKLPAGDYLIGKPLESGAVDIYYQGIELPSNVQFTLDNDARIYMDPNDKWNYCIIRLSNSENVVIRGGTLIGDRYEHIYTPRSNGQASHDEGHGICIEDGARILIDNILFKELTGDGVLAIAGAHDITIRNNEMSTNRRQGISIVGSYRVNIQNNYIHDTRGANPEFGVDIEGDSRGKDIVIQGNQFYGNRGGSVLNATGRNVFIRNNTMNEHDNANFRYTTAPITIWQRADAVISGNTIAKRAGTTGDGIIEYRGGFLGTDDGTRKLFIHNNSCRGCGLILRPSFSGIDIRDNRFGGHIFWLLDVKNATVIGNNHEGSSPTNCFSFRFQQVTGQASGNTFNGLPYDLPLSESSPYSNDCPVTDP